MPAGTKLRNRLTLWSMILLVLFLGAGGFFCYYTQQQELQDSLDEKLLLLSRNFACDYREAAPDNSTQSDFCSDFYRLSINQAGEQAVALYSLQGEPLCSNRHPLSIHLSLTPDASANSAAGGIYFETIRVDPKQKIRRLTSPVASEGQILYHLQLADSTDKIDRELSKYSLFLLAGGLFTVICLSLCQWSLLGLITIPLHNLSQTMDATDEENLTPKVIPSPLASCELEQLADSYNKLTERLGSSLQKTRQFATDVTHELRTPLTILRGETELALRGEKDAEELRQVLNSNLEEISRMGHLVEDLLLLSKSELGEIPLKMEALNLNELLEELHFQGNIIAEPKQITVELQGPDQQVSLYADPHRIRQVFLNLLTNGIKYTPDGGRVTIDWALQDDSVRVIFKDTGIGIDSEHQQHIFDRFYRINKTSNRNDGGSGLGLAIVKWLVEAHGGSVVVCSVPGQGSSFAVVLPVTRKPEIKPTNQGKSKN